MVKKEDHPFSAVENYQWIKLSRKEIKCLLAYYCLLELLLLLLLCKFLYHISFCELYETNVFYIFILSLICGGLGGAFYYLRKLYKSCIQSKIDDTDFSNSIQKLGAKIYFYCRPIMGAILAAMVILGVYGGFFFLQSQPAVEGERFYLFTVVIGFILGYSNGNVMTKLDEEKDKITSKIKDNKGDN